MKNSLILIFMLFSVNTLTYAVDYYISSSGDDNNNGLSASSPFRTIEKVNSIFSRLEPGDRILFNRGNTFFGTLKIAKSGLAGSPIAIGAYGTGDDPIITGFSTLNSWTYEGESIYSKTISLESSTYIVVSVNGINTPIGRYPNAGTKWLTIDSHNAGTTLTDADLNSSLMNWTGADIVSKTYDFIMERHTISNHTNQTLVFDAFGIGLESKRGYFIENDLQTLDATNEWYYDGMKFYIFGDPSAKTVKVSSLVNAVIINSFDYITFDHISFTGFGGDGISLVDASHITIQNCNISFCGENGIMGNNETLGNSNNCLFDSNIISEINNNGIYVKSQFKNITVRNNSLNNIGLIPGAAHYLSAWDAYFNGIILKLSSNNDNSLIEYNNLTNIGYCGISMYGVNITAQYNFVNNFCLILSDGGGIYTYTELMNVDENINMFYNIVLNGIGNTDGGFLDYANGIYIDGFSRDVTVEYNTASGCSGSNIMINGNRFGIVRYNTAYDAIKEYTDNFKLSRFSDIIDIHENLVIEHNIFFARNASERCAFFISTSSDISATVSTDYNYYARPISGSDPVCIRYHRNKTEYTLAGWRKFRGDDAHSGLSPVAVSNINEIRFEYNVSKKNKVITLDKPMIDVTGKKFANSITLLPYTSVVLMVDPNPTQTPDPIFLSSAIENNTPSILELTYNLRLANVVPDLNAFVVMVNSMAIIVNYVTVSDTKVMLTLANPIVFGDIVTVSYTKPTTNPLQTLAGRQAASVSMQPVSNNVNVISPVYVSSSIEDTSPSILTITFSRSLADIVPGLIVFSVMVNSKARPVNTVAVAGTKVILTLSKPVVYDDYVTVAYTKPLTDPLQTAAGEQVASISAQIVTNRVITINAPPVIVVNYKSSSFSGFVEEINASRSYDTNKDNLTFTWVIPDNVPVSSTSGSSIKYLGPIVNSSQTIEFILQISDGTTTLSEVIPVEIIPYKKEMEAAQIANIEASSFQTPYYPYNCIDGNIGTMWSANGYGQWLVVELKESFNIQHIKLVFQPGQRKEYYFDLLGSMDKVTWDPILTKTASCDFSGDLQVFEFPPSKTGLKFNYLKLVGQCNSIDQLNNISELKIFGTNNHNTSAYEKLPVKIYPNPAQDFVNIKIDEATLNPDFYQLIDLSGTIVSRGDVYPEVREFTIPINLKRGTYILQLGSAKWTLFSQKLVVAYYKGN